MELDKKDRLILYNQYEILKSLNLEDSHLIEQYELNQEILVNGYKYNYDDLVVWMSSDTPDNISEFVWDVFRMYRILNNSYHELSAEEHEKIEVKGLKYQGFDGNEEGDYYTYASFILKKLKSYEDLFDNGHVTLNSHTRKVPLYTSMLSRWDKITHDKYQTLSVEQIKIIIND